MTNKTPIIWAYKKISRSSGGNESSGILNPLIEKGLYNWLDERRLFCRIDTINEISYEMKFTTFNDCPRVFSLPEKLSSMDIIEPQTLKGCIKALGEKGGRISRYDPCEYRRNGKKIIKDEVIIYPWDIIPNPEGWFNYLCKFEKGKIKIFQPNTHKEITPSSRLINRYLEKILRGIEVEPIAPYEKDNSQCLSFYQGLNY